MQPRETIVREGTVAQGSKSNIWKPVFYGTTATGAAALGFTIYEWTKANDTDLPGKSQSDCGKPGEPTTACSHYQKYLVGVVVSSVLGAAVIGSFYMAYLRDSGEPEVAGKTASRGHRKRREFAVTPVVTPQGGGATLQFDW
jgi:hypothetical protein